MNESKLVCEGESLVYQDSEITEVRRWKVYQRPDGSGYELSRWETRQFWRNDHGPWERFELLRVEIELCTREARV